MAFCFMESTWSWIKIKFGSPHKIAVSTNIFLNNTHTPTCPKKSHCLTKKTSTSTPILPPPCSFIHHLFFTFEPNPCFPNAAWVSTNHPPNHPPFQCHANGAEELNFPIGCRDPIDLSGYRWNLPIHLIEGEEKILPFFFLGGGTGGSRLLRWFYVFFYLGDLVKHQKKQTKMGWMYSRKRRLMGKWGSQANGIPEKNELRRHFPSTLKPLKPSNPVAYSGFGYGWVVLIVHDAIWYQLLILYILLGCSW